MISSVYNKVDKILLAVDCIIFGFDGKDLKALLVKRAIEPQKDKWSLMGGFVQKEESVDDAAIRVLSLLTGLKDIYMEQLYCFGDVNRDSAGRVVSIVYFALIKIDDYHKDLLKEHHAKWFSLDKLPTVIFDYKQMIELSRQRLQEKVISHPIGFELLPAKFTLQQLQALYEAVYNTSFDNRNFTKKILSLGLLIKLNEKDKESSKKGSFLYEFDNDKYNKLNKEGLRFL